jgi:O-acetyl-ADP-ribose deacetylase (regulator of RNase III)
MKIVKGNIIKMALNGDFDVIIHGCNCFNTMGAGIAKQIKDNFPEAYKADQETKKGDKNKLGNYTAATIIRNNVTFVVVNAYIQYYYGTGHDISYISLLNVMEKIAKHYNCLKMAYPKIGCGLAGGKWYLVSAIINEKLNGQNHTYVEYKGD